MTTPVLVLIPGAWHPPHLYDALTTALARHCPTSTLHLPTLSPDESRPLPTLASDVQAARAHIRGLLRSPTPPAVHILAHSYGGVVASHLLASHPAFLAATRRHGGGIASVTYLCAYMLGEGESVASVSGAPASSSEVMALPAAVAERMFAGSGLGGEAVAAAAAQLVPHAVSPLREVQEGEPGWMGEVGVGYVVCEGDAVLDVETQVGMVRAAERGGHEG